MLHETIKSALSHTYRWQIKCCLIVSFAVPVTLFSSALCQKVSAEPIVVLEYRGNEAVENSVNSTHPFRMDPDYSTHHLVRPNETLSHIIVNYYGGSGLDKAFVQMAIVKKISLPLCEETRIIYMRANLCIFPPLMKLRLC